MTIIQIYIYFKKLTCKLLLVNFIIQIKKYQLYLLSIHINSLQTYNSIKITIKNDKHKKIYKILLLFLIHKEILFKIYKKDINERN